MQRSPANALRLLLDNLAAKGMDARPCLRALRQRLAPAGQAAGLVSIILPTRDRAATIGRAIESVLAQSYLNWELIIVDDGGTDPTPVVVKPYLADRRIRYYRRAALGPPSARNAALKIARGELVAYIDSDNHFDSGFIEGIVSVFADPQVQSAYGMLIREEDGVAPVTLFTAFDRDNLLQANFIDINVYVHRYSLFAQFGGFDEQLKRLADWDLILRYTVASPAAAVAVPGAYYRTDATNRISDKELFSPAYRRIQAKWREVRKTSRPVRVLYALAHYPELSQIGVEAEMQAMRRYGVHVEVWSPKSPSTLYETGVMVHRETLAAAIAAARPDAVHVHRLSLAMDIVDVVQPLGIPVTVHGHAVDPGDAMLENLLAHPAVRRVYVYPPEMDLPVTGHPKLRAIDNAFNTALFRPGLLKNPRLVVRASAALPERNLAFFVRLALRCPDHRFVLCIAADKCTQNHADELLALRGALQSPVEILLNVAPAQLADLLYEAGIYLHTAIPPEPPSGKPLGQPSSIIEAMASGALILVKDVAPFVRYAGDAGVSYRHEDDAARLILDTANWDAVQWGQAAKRSVERAWTHFTGDAEFYMMYQDWASLID